LPCLVALEPPARTSGHAVTPQHDAQPAKVQHAIAALKAHPALQPAFAAD
jgi:hypothetical protein